MKDFEISMYTRVCTSEKREALITMYTLHLYYDEWVHSSIPDKIDVKAYLSSIQGKNIQKYIHE